MLGVWDVRILILAQERNGGVLNAAESRSNFVAMQATLIIGYIAHSKHAILNRPMLTQSPQCLFSCQIPGESCACNPYLLAGFFHIVRKTPMFALDPAAPLGACSGKAVPQICTQLPAGLDQERTLLQASVSLIHADPIGGTYADGTNPIHNRVARFWLILLDQADIPPLSPPFFAQSGAFKRPASALITSPSRGSISETTVADASSSPSTCFYSNTYFRVFPAELSAFNASASTTRLLPRKRLPSAARSSSSGNRAHNAPSTSPLFNLLNKYQM